MPKPSKTKPKQKVKPKRNAEPEETSFTTKKAYWITLSGVLAITAAVLSLLIGLDATRAVIFTITVLVPIGVYGYIRVTPSNLSLSKRLTFLFIGASVIGFGIWAAIVLIGGFYGLTASLVNAWGSQFFVTTSLVICFSVGIFVGELIGKIKSVQIRLFNSLEDKQ